MSTNDSSTAELVESRAKAEVIVNHALDWITKYYDQFATTLIKQLVTGIRDLTHAMQGRSSSAINEKVSALLKTQQLMLGPASAVNQERRPISQIFDPTLYRLHREWRPSDSFAPENHSDRPPSRRDGSVFVSYAREDRLWLERLNRHLRPLVRNGKIDIWHDQMIAPGRNWMDEIEGALSVSSVAILLLSSAFVASDFIYTHELPRIAERASRKGVVILPLVVGHCLLDEIQYIKDVQVFNDPEHPLGRLDHSSVEKILLDLARTVRDLQHVGSSNTNSPAF